MRKEGEKKKHLPHLLPAVIDFKDKVVLVLKSLLYLYIYL
jgi:hypothetical protein